MESSAEASRPGFSYPVSWNRQSLPPVSADEPSHWRDGQMSLLLSVRLEKEENEQGG